METQVEPIKAGRRGAAALPQLQNTIKTPLLSEISHIYRRLQPPKGFLLFLVLCLLGRRVMTSLPLLEFWLHVLPLVVLKTPSKNQISNTSLYWRSIFQMFCLLAGELAYFIACCVDHLCLCRLLSESLEIFFSQVFKD